MSMQQYPSNPIEARKQAVRKYSRNAVAFAGGGVIGGVALALLAHSWELLVLGLIIAVIGVVMNWRKVQKIVNHQDQY